jgi:hypothetical protein
VDPNDLVRFSKGTIDFLELDKQTFKYVLDNRATLPGGLGFAMVTTAMAAFDVYAYLLYQRYDQSKKHSDIFSALIKDARFFDVGKYISARTFYSTIRCGVMHQLYPKDGSIVAYDTPTTLFEHFDKICVNAYALFCDVLEGIRKIHTHFESLTDEKKLDYVLKLKIREKSDAEQGDVTLSQIKQLSNLAMFQATLTTSPQPQTTKPKPTTP